MRDSCLWRHIVPTTLALFSVLVLSVACDAQEASARMLARTQGLPAPSLQSPGPSDELRISPDDVLDIYVMDVQEISRQYRVSPAGLITLPLLDAPIRAAGLNASELADALCGHLREAGLVSNPYVVVSIVASRLKSVAITGAVKMPQLYPVFGATTLLDVLSQAQGLTEEAGSVALITRGGAREESNSRATVESVDLTRLLETGSPENNPPVYAGDRITVPTAGVVYVVGAVTRPGGFPIRSTREGMTVLKAVALAEGVKSTAIRGRVTIIRRTSTGHEQLPLDLKAILAGRAVDPVLQASDILFIPDSEGAKALRRGMEAALQVATGVVIYRR